MEQKPSVGRIVHYVAYGTPGGEFPSGVCRAAIITEVYEGKQMVPTGDVIQLDDQHVGRVDPEKGHCTTVGLCVLNPTGQYFNRGIRYDEQKAPGTWHWPERT